MRAARERYSVAIDTRWRGRCGNGNRKGKTAIAILVASRLAKSLSVPSLQLVFHDLVALEAGLL